MSAVYNNESLMLVMTADHDENDEQHVRDKDDDLFI